MDQKKTGALLRALRQELGLTQRALAESLGVSDKAVSKWERGAGCPDVSLLPDLARILGVELEAILSGQLDAQAVIGGNMKKLEFYVCPACGNLLTSTGAAAVSCCGKRLAALTPQTPDPAHQVAVEQVERDYFITADHPMEKEHFIAFAALLTTDSLLLRKQYPEWDLQARIPNVGHGTLVWYCGRHGLFAQHI